MFPILLTLLICGFILPTYAVPLQTASELSRFYSQPNNSASALNARPTVKCDSRYGVDLDVLDCRNALLQILSGTKLVTLKDRENIAVGDAETLPLPFRIMGSKLLAD